MLEPSEVRAPEGALGRKEDERPLGDVRFADLLELAISIADADMGNVQALEHSTRTLRIVAYRGFEPPFLEFFARVEAGEAAACGAALAARAPMLVPDVEESALFRGGQALEVLRGAGVRAVLSVPAVDDEGDVVGATRANSFSRSMNA
ncbi:MAG TPA: GAF domain-containing protein [Anaeromyxobacter sp.]|jgi:hypothetical protein|nr:GAF domain-containing protein [Anaeromyxobacter sp.]